MAALVLAFCVYALLARAQSLSPGEVRFSSRPYQPRSVLRSESRLVQLEVVVRDSHGRAVIGLSKDDFAVFDSGRNRDLAAFSIELSSPVPPAASLSGNPPPQSPSEPSSGAQQRDSSPSSAPNTRWIALHFDDVNTSAGDLAHAKVASKRFVKEADASGEHIGVFTTSAGRVLDFTSDTSAVLASIATVQAHPRMSPSGLSSCPRITPYEAYQIISNNAGVMRLKLVELCRCGGSDNTNAVCNSAESEGSSGILLPTYEKGSGGDLIESIKAQAQQTWDLANLTAQSTLQAIGGDLDLLARKSGNRILLFASSGFLSGMLEVEQDSIVNQAVRAGVVINALDAKGLYAESPGGPINESVEVVEVPVSSTVFQIQSLADRLDDLDSAMARFAESTGGLLFRNNNDLDLGFRQLGVVPACTYLLGFTPADDGKYHKIKVELKNKIRNFVQVRPGYFAPTNAPTVQPSTVGKMDAIMAGSDEKADLPAAFTEKVEVAKSGGPQLTIQAHIDIQKLSFDLQKDRHVQKLTFLAALFNSQGNLVTGKQADMELALKPESFDRFSKSGINGVMQLDAPAGTYRLRVVVQESLHGTLSATTKNLQIP